MFPMDDVSENHTTASDNDQRYRFILLAREPVGGWERAMREWGNGWIGFRFFFIAVNVTLLLWSLSNIVLMARRRNLLSKTYFMTLNAMALLFALTRTLFYSVDPYGVNSLVPKPIVTILLDLGFPCLTVGFTMLYVGLRQFTTPDSFVNNLFLKKYFIVIFVVVCFLISLATDLAVAYAHSTTLMVVVCQFFYILLGFIFFVLFLYMSCTVRKLVASTRRKTKKMCYRRGHCIRQTPSSRLKTTPAIVIVGGIAAFMFLCIAALNLYLVFVEFGLIRETILTEMCNRYRKLWPFYSYMCLVSLCEHAMALSLTICGSQPSKCMRLRKIRTDFTGISSTTDFSSEMELERVDVEAQAAAPADSHGKSNTAFTNEYEASNSPVDSLQVASVAVEVESNFHLTAQVHQSANS